MPEFNKRVIVKGLKAAERDFGDYVKQRLAAEKGTDALLRELRELEAKAAQTRKSAEARRGR